MSQAHVDAVRRSLDGWNRDDFDACVSIAHPEIEWASELAKRMHGPKPLQEGHRRAPPLWDEWRRALGGEARRDGVDRSGRHRARARQTRARGDASGVGFEQLIGYVYEFEDGMARRVRSYHDPGRAFEAVGLPR